MRVRVWGPGGNEVEDFGPDYGESNPATTYNPPTFERSPAGGGTAAEMWLFTVCGPDEDQPGQYECPTIANSTPTFGRVGSVRLTLDDPDNPIVAVESNPQIDDGWVNKRRTQRLSVTAADPSSGISRIRVQVRTGGSTTGGRTLTDTRVTCDEDHRTAGRNGLICPPSATATATDPGSSQTAGDRTYVVTAWDYAGNQSETTQTVRRDSEAPSSGDASGAELRQLTDGWTNHVGQVPVRLTGEDSRAGVSRIQLLARRELSGRTSTLTDIATPCVDGCRAVSRTAQATIDATTLPRDGRYALSVRVTDRAGNARTFATGRVLKIDREAPATPGGYVAHRADGWYAFVRPAPESGGKSPLRDVEVEYSTSRDPGVATVRAAASALPLVRTARGRFRVIRLADFLPSQLAPGPATQVLAASPAIIRMAEPRLTQYDGAGNPTPSATLPVILPRAGTGWLGWCRQKWGASSCAQIAAIGVAIVGTKFGQGSLSVEVTGAESVVFPAGSNGADTANAWRHTFWISALTLWGRTHEKGDDVGIVVGRKNEGGKWSEGSSVLPRLRLDSRMDMYNNSFGKRLGDKVRAGTSYRDLCKLVMTAVMQSRKVPHPSVSHHGWKLKTTIWRSDYQDDGYANELDRPRDAYANCDALSGQNGPSS
jgi:hypothetical protein